MSIENWNAQKLDRYREALDLGLHDDSCEQQERSSLCHCSKRRREAAGHTGPVRIWFHAPTCGRCDNTLDHDGDCWRCHNCKVTWDTNASDGDTTDDYWDEYGDSIGDERFGRRLINIVRGNPW